MHLKLSSPRWKGSLLHCLVISVLEKKTKTVLTVFWSCKLSQAPLEYLLNLDILPVFEDLRPSENYEDLVVNGLTEGGQVSLEQRQSHSHILYLKYHATCRFAHVIWLVSLKQFSSFIVSAVISREDMVKNNNI